MADGNRVLVRNDVVDRSVARALVSEGNNGAAIRGGGTGTSPFLTRMRSMLRARVETENGGY